MSSENAAHPPIEPTQALTKQEQNRAEITIAEGKVEFRSLDALYRFAQYVSVSGLAPKDFKTPEQITVAMVFALELGYHPLTGIQNISLVNGRASVWGDLPYAKITAHPDFIDIEETFEGDGKLDTLVAVCKATRRNRAVVTRRYSWQDALVARDADKDTYKKNPRRMLQWRARWWALKDLYGDVIRNVDIREPGEASGGMYAPEVAPSGTMAQMRESKAAPAEPAEVSDAIDAEEVQPEPKAAATSVRRRTATKPAPDAQAPAAASEAPKPAERPAESPERSEALKALHRRLVDHDVVIGDVMKRFGVETFRELTDEQIAGLNAECDAMSAPAPKEEELPPWEPSPRETLIADLRTQIQDAGQMEAVVVAAYDATKAKLEDLSDAELKAVSSEVSEWEVN